MKTSTCLHLDQRKAKLCAAGGGAGAVVVGCDFLDLIGVFLILVLSLRFV